MRITLYLNDKIINYKLPNEILGSFSFYEEQEGDSKLINIEARKNNWILYGTKDVTIVNDNILSNEVQLVPNNFYVLKKDNKNYLIYISKLENQNMLTYSYNDSINFIIANADYANIRYNCKYMNDLAIKISKSNNKLILEKAGNGNIYINELCLKNMTYTIKNGDKLELYGLRIFFLNGLILINTIDSKINIQLGNSGLLLYNFPNQDKPQNLEFKDVELYVKDDYFSKSPRLRRIIETKTIKLSPPPRDSESPEMPIILVIGPMLTMGIMSLTMVINTITKIRSGETTLEASWPQLITSGAMLISMLLWPLVTQAYNRRMKKKKKKEILEKYTKYLDEKRMELSKEANSQKIILFENLINIQECLNIIKHKGVNFWDKRIDQSDFLVVRIGVGSQLLDAKIEYPEEGFTIEESELRKKADELIASFKYINDVPVSYSLYENRNVAIMGNDYKTVNFMHNIILQLITFYSYEDIKIVMFTNEERKNEWDYLKYLNHTFTNDKSFRFFATDYESTKNVSEYLNYEANVRMNMQQNRDKVPDKPYYIIIVDDYEQIKHYDFVDLVTESEENLGFSLIILENKLSKLPSKCNNFITIGENKSSLLNNSYEKQEQINFVDEIDYNLDMMSIAKILSNIPIEFEEGIKQLPDSVTFLEMEKVGKVEQLNILNRWNTNDSTTSLKAEVGVDELGNLMYLDLHEKYHGPHGLIAGMTGSGKSEFIITYILSMAINYSPDDIAFILIDYKGGGLAFAFENKLNNIVLPHLAGTITNLDKAEMDRTLVSIDSEIKRRQSVFNQARDRLGESTIDIYKYQRFYKEGKLEEPIPHLFIICDEFAELKSQQPEFMDNLISVARIGRSLGVHLILATQKPSGVVNEQIWSNTKFRVCLKVQDEQDSKEMLKRPEAASLKQAGRFYLQVGFDEYFALGQSGWCGAKYYPSDNIVKQVDKSINFIDSCGNYIKSIQASNGIKIEPKGEQLAAIMNSIIEVSNRINKRAKKLWLDNIPNIILEDDLREKYNVEIKPYEVEAIIGEYDAPEKQLQGLVKYNYLNDGNTIIYGNDGSERELLLNTIIYSTIKSHSAEEINYYIVDYGSESFEKYLPLPHVGGVVLASEEEEYNNLLKLLKKEIQKRKKLFANYGGEYINYLKSNPDKMPIKTVIINNYDSVYESHPELYDELPDLIRDSERYGIIFILTANAINSIQTKVSQNFKNIYAFKLKDQSDYTTIFGIRSKIMPRDIFGRGLVKNDGIHEFQVASIVKDENELSEYLLKFIDNLKLNSSKRAKKIPILPDIVKIEDIKSCVSNLNSVPVGISKKELNVCLVDYLSNIGNIITANKIDYTEKFVKSLLMIFKYLPNNTLIVIDAMKKLYDQNNQYQNYYDDDFDNVIDNITNSIKDIDGNNSTNNGIILIYGLKKFITKLKDTNKFSDLLKALKEYEKIGIIIVDDATKIKGYAFESWFLGTFSTNDGIWIGKGISDQNLLHLSSVNREMTKEIKNDMGYIISESSAVLSRMIDFITLEKDDDNE